MLLVFIAGTRIDRRGSCRSQRIPLGVSLLAAMGGALIMPGQAQDATAPMANATLQVTEAPSALPDPPAPQPPISEPAAGAAAAATPPPTDFWNRPTLSGDCWGHARPWRTTV